MERFGTIWIRSLLQLAPRLSRPFRESVLTGQVQEHLIFQDFCGTLWFDSFLSMCSQLNPFRHGWWMRAWHANKTSMSNMSFFFRQTWHMDINRKNAPMIASYCTGHPPSCKFVYTPKESTLVISNYHPIVSGIIKPLCYHHLSSSIIKQLQNPSEIPFPCSLASEVPSPFSYANSYKQILWLGFSYGNSHGKSYGLAAGHL